MLTERTDASYLSLSQSLSVLENEISVLQTKIAEKEKVTSNVVLRMKFEKEKEALVAEQREKIEKKQEIIKKMGDIMDSI